MTFTEEDYNSLIEDIFHRFPSVSAAGFSTTAYKPGLRHMEDFCEALGHPERSYRTIHIAGTNGKGSVANMLAAALTSSGLSTGLYTSPHIVDFRERMRIGSTLVDREYVYAFLRTWLPYITAHSLSFFEITTGLAFRWFADSHVDIAVIETGLGGRLDSTNVITPILSVITSIGLDHCDILGNTRSAIASEKAGIIKPSVPVIIGTRDGETSPVFDAAAMSLHSPITYADSTPKRPGQDTLLERMDLKGAYQGENLRTVLAAIDILTPVIPSLNDTGRVFDGIARTATLMDFHGRWERLSYDPLTICDIGHNAHALRHNFAQLQSLLDSGSVSDLIIIYGVMADKDLDAIIPLFPDRARLIFTTPDTPRALSGDNIASRFKTLRTNLHDSHLTPSGSAAVTDSDPIVTPDVPSAISLARTMASALPRPLIYIGGSTYVVSDAVKVLRP